MQVTCRAIERTVVTENEWPGVALAGWESGRRCNYLVIKVTGVRHGDFLLLVSCISGYRKPRIRSSCFAEPRPLPSTLRISNQMGHSTLLSERFEFPYPLPAEDRTQISLRFLCPPAGQRRKQVR